MARTKQPGWSPVVDIASGEVVPRGRRITIGGGRFSPDSVHAVVTSGGGDVTVEHSDGELVLDTASLEPGRHLVHVEGVPAGKQARQDFRFEFVVVETPAELSQKHVVLHAVRMRIGELDVERLPLSKRVEGAFFDVFKAVGRGDGEPSLLAFDQNGEPVDLEAELKALGDRRHKEYGRVEPALAERLGAGGTVEVAVWANLPADAPGAALPEKSPRSPAKRPPASERDARKVWEEAAAKLADVGARFRLEVRRVDTAAPVVYGSMPAEAVRELAEHELVAAVFGYDPTGEVDLGNSIAVANSDDAHNAGFTGSGVRVAVYEDGPDVTTNLSIAGQFTTSPTLSNHARLTHAVIKNTQANAPHGHAPDVSLFSANSMDLDAIRWAAQDQGCTVISQSFHRTAEQTSSGLSHDDMYKDWLALHWPFPTIVEASGNGTSTEFVNHKGFNRLTAGSHDDSATAMASDSVFRNPASTHGDREQPEIAANGIGVTAVGLTMSGTSFAAPATAGVAAVLQQAAPVLQSWPEGCRAILQASAWRNPSGGRWRADLIAGVDGRDGAGAVDAEAAVSIAQSRQQRNNAGSLRGWDIGTLRTGDLSGGLSTFTYRIKTPARPIFWGQHVKVALAWDSNATRTDFLFFDLLSDSLTVDLDLHVRDSAGNFVAFSSSFDNSYEIAEFDAKAGETYEVSIRRWSGTDDVWYGIAWTQVSTLFDIFGSINSSPVTG